MKNKKNVVGEILKETRSECWRGFKKITKIVVLAVICVIVLIPLILLIYFFDLSKISIAMEIEIFGLVLCMFGSMFVLGPLLDSMIFNNLFFEILHGKYKEWKEILLDKNAIEKEDFKSTKIYLFLGILFLTVGFFLQIISKVI